jgi:hypothetical protein
MAGPLIATPDGEHGGFLVVSQGEGVAFGMLVGRWL